MYINAEGATEGGGQYFEGVTPDVWAYPVGGYMPAQKWLQDRRERKLNFDDLQRFARIVGALSETPLILQEIEDAVGGWPPT